MRVVCGAALAVAIVWCVWIALHPSWIGRLHHPAGDGSADWLPSGVFAVAGGAPAAAVAPIWAPPAPNAGNIPATARWPWQPVTGNQPHVRLGEVEGRAGERVEFFATAGNDPLHRVTFEGAGLAAGDPLAAHDVRLGFAVAQGVVDTADQAKSNLTAGRSRLLRSRGEPEAGGGEVEVVADDAPAANARVQVDGLSPTAWGDAAAKVTRFAPAQAFQQASVRHDVAGWRLSGTVRQASRQRDGTVLSAARCTSRRPPGNLPSRRNVRCEREVADPPTRWRTRPLPDALALPRTPYILCAWK